MIEEDEGTNHLPLRCGKGAARLKAVEMALDD
jgi:hypothetical protein